MESRMAAVDFGCHPSQLEVNVVLEQRLHIALSDIHETGAT